ncbi:MAG: hypothetical protein ACUZ8E_17475 [Candidatus Anammoxibacter sp.]
MPISKPDVTLNIIAAKAAAIVAEQKVLIVAQKIAAGTATAGAVEVNVSDATNVINALFGTRSILADMVREFKKLNKETQLDVIALDDASGTPATGVITITGTATEAGSLNISFGSDKRHKVKVDIASGDSATVVGASITAAFALILDAPFQVTDAIGVVTATAENDGTHANDWSIRVDGAVAGVAAVITNWASGATDPSLTGVLDAIGDTRYQTIIWPAVFDITIVEDVLNTRFNTSNDVLDGVAVQVLKGTLSSLKSATSALNSQSLLIVGDKTVDEVTRKGTALREIPDVTAAEIGALRALRLTEGTNLTLFLTTTASLDQFGGVHVASLPYFNTALPNLPIPFPEDEFSRSDQDELNSNAVSLLGANRALNTTIFGEMVTTYLTDTAGNADTSFKFLNTVDTISTIRETFFVNYKKRYAQTRLTNGDLEARFDMANVESIRAFSLEVYRSLADDVLVQSGGVAEKDFLDNLIIVLDLAKGEASITMAPLLVSQLRVIVGTVQVNFGG